MDGLARRPREVVGDAGDSSFLLDEVFRGGVDGRAGGLEGLEGLGDGSLGGSFSCNSNSVPQCQGLVGQAFTLTTDDLCGGSESRTSLLSRVAKGSIPSEPSIACSSTISTASRSVFWELVGSLRDVTGLEEKPTPGLNPGIGCGGDWDEVAAASTCDWPHGAGGCIAAKYAGLG